MQNKLMKTPDQVVEIAVESVKLAKKYFRLYNGPQKMLLVLIGTFLFVLSMK